MGSDLRKALESCQVEIFTQPAPVGPIVNGASSGQFEADGTTRAPIAAGGVLNVEGDKLKLAGDSPEVGVTLTSVSDPDTSYFIPRNAMLINEPKRLMFLLRLQVLTRIFRSILRKTVAKSIIFTVKAPCRS